MTGYRPNHMTICGTKEYTDGGAVHARHAVGSWLLQVVLRSAQSGCRKVAKLRERPTFRWKKPTTWLHINTAYTVAHLYSEL